MSDFNKDRSRRYGLRVGDIVEVSGFRGEIFSLDLSDNNACLVIRESDGKELECLCEHCQIITKVEDRSENEKN